MILSNIVSTSRPNGSPGSMASSYVDMSPRTAAKSILVIPLRFRKSVNPEIERWYATHFVDTKRVSQPKTAAAKKADQPC